jgi:hypothetical protein
LLFSNSEMNLSIEKLHNSSQQVSKSPTLSWWLIIV